VWLSPDGRLALSGGYETTLRLWEITPQSQEICTLQEAPTESIVEQTTSPAEFTNLLKSGEEALHARRFSEALALVTQARALPGGEQAPQSVDLWACLSLVCPRVGLRAVRPIRTLEGHSEPVRSVLLSPDGGSGLSSGWDATVRLWDLTTGQCQRILTGHEDWVMTLSWSQDGQQVLSGSDDKTLRLWNLDKGTEICCLEGHTDWVSSVVFAPDGRTALSGSNDQTLRLWRLPDR